MNLDEGARLWEDLKAETGYTPYFAYLEAHEENHSHLWFSKEALRDLIVNTAPSYDHGCAIVDVQGEDSTCCKLNLRCRSTSGTKILSALRQPPATTSFGIVLWDSTSLNEETLDALALGLKLRVHFFNAFLARHPKTPARLDLGTGWKISDDVVVIGQYVMTFVRDYLPANPDAAPIILIAGVDQDYLQINSDLDETFAFQNLATQATKKMPNSLDQLSEWMREYFRRLEIDIKKGKGLGRNDMDLTFSPLTALLQFNMPLFRLECRAARAYYFQATKSRHTETVEKSLKDVFKRRYLLRRMIEDSEDNSLRLRDYTHSLMRHDTPQSQSLMTLEGDLQQIRLEATRLEAEIRDYLQLQTGELALEESKNSIELSNFQIEEAKRGKFKLPRNQKLLAKSSSENL
ncbi:MAG: hypothetical protein ALECFALPRED_004113 [Alectoria fallacina]|uniref:Uncharacterized protein n=1 Tax=Alectoria fallacina TaxID=1903189 RepID=A0A8H3FWI2_9LECA|nr:MAG: hypothetical protein ALECFALPRED_004113 [Alectoria fallacina]